MPLSSCCVHDCHQYSDTIAVAAAAAPLPPPAAAAATAPAAEKGALTMPAWCAHCREPITRILAAAAAVVVVVAAAAVSCVLPELQGVQGAQPLQGLGHRCPASGPEPVVAGDGAKGQNGAARSPRVRGARISPATCRSSRGPLFALRKLERALRRARSTTSWVFCHDPVPANRLEEPECHGTKTATVQTGKGREGGRVGGWVGG